jgi:hypothetical protein
MRNILKATIAVASFLAALATAASSAAGSEVPMKLRDTGSAAIVAASGPVVHTEDTGVGEATHLGRYTLAATQDINLATGAVTNGSFTLTAANGDTVRGTYSGQALPGLVGYTVSGPITGGTGRFAGATGFLVWRGTVDPAALTFTDEITGTISAVGNLD